MRVRRLRLSDAAAVRQTGGVLTRSSGYLTPRTGKVPTASKDLESEGYAVLRGVFKPPAVESLCGDVQRVFDEYAPDVRDPDDDDEQMAPFRYEMLNRSSLVQRAIANPRILRTIEPLLGEDCHVISNTAWWQPPGNNEHLGRSGTSTQDHTSPETPTSRGTHASHTRSLPSPRTFSSATARLKRVRPLSFRGAIRRDSPHRSIAWPIPIWSATAAVPYPWLPKQAMWRSLFPISGTRGCRRPATTWEGLHPMPLRAPRHCTADQTDIAGQPSQ